jgi:hypothetical protein
MSETNSNCCPECGTDRTALLAEIAEHNAAVEAQNAELRVHLEQRMEAGEDISPLLELLEREGFDISKLLVG